MLQEEAKKRQATSTGGCYGAKPLQAKLPEGVCSNNFNGLRGQARDIAARAVGVGGRTVQKALTLKKAEPETFEKIKRGEITVEKALHETKTSVPGKRQQIVASAAYRRMVACFAQIEGGCKGLNGLNLRVALTQCPNGEKKHWRREVLERTKELRAFGRELQRAEK